MWFSPKRQYDAKTTNAENKIPNIGCLTKLRNISSRVSSNKTKQVKAAKRLNDYILS